MQLLFPEYCAVCKRAGSSICLECLSQEPPPECPRDEWIFSLHDYRRRTVRTAIHRLKYENRRGTSGVFAEALYGAILEELSELSLLENFSDPILAPVPISKARRKERGYNQSELISRDLERISNGFIKNGWGALEKTRETEHQARIYHRAERMANVTETFAAKNAEMIRGRNLVLVDDVTTTGATLAEARKILLAAGARRVIAFTVAH